MRYRDILVLAAGILLWAGMGTAVSFPVHDTYTWNQGTFENTAESDGKLELTASTGSYQSRTFDAGDTYAWDALEVDAALNGGSAEIRVEVSDDNFSTTTDQFVFPLNGGRETFNISGMRDARYVRFNYTLEDGATVDDTNVTIADDVTFLVRDRGCQAEERELFSVSGRENAHAAEPGFYDRQVCASGIDRSDYDTVCTEAETETLSFFDADATYVHLSTDAEANPYKLCTGELSVGIRDSCPGTTKAIVSIYEQPESHVAMPGVYEHQLCGAIFEDISLMMQFHLSDDDEVYINNTNVTPGVYEQDRQSGFISAEDDSMVAGIVSGENTLTNMIGYGEDGQDHVFNVTQPRQQGASYFVPFTQGDRLTLENRRDDILRGEFLTQVNPNFAFEFISETAVELTLELTQVDLVTDMVLSSGIHRLVIRNLGTNANGEPRVGINVTAQ